MSFSLNVTYTRIKLEDQPKIFNKNKKDEDVGPNESLNESLQLLPNKKAILLAFILTKSMIF